MNKQIILLFFIINSFNVLFSQEKILNEFFTYLRNENYNQAKILISKLDLNNQNCNESKEFYFLVHLLQNKGVLNNSNSFKNIYSINKCSKKKLIKSISKLNLALFNFYYNKNPKISIHSTYVEALELITKTNYNTLKTEIIRRILEYHNNIFVLQDFSFKKYIKMYKNISTDKIDLAIADFYNLTIGIKNSESNLTKEDFIISKKLIKKLKIKSFNTKLKIIIGNYLEENKNNKEALKYYQSALNEINDNSVGANVMLTLNCKMNIGIFYYYNKQYKKALKYFKINSNLKGKLVDRKKIYYDYWLSLTYEKLKNYEKAYDAIKRSRRNQFSFNQKNHLQTIREIETKYETEKKEKENLQLKQKNLQSETERKQSQNLFYGVSILLILGGIITYLNLKNSKRKRLLAEQQKELEKQKNLTLIKEQEITTINAMIDGQEKERVRIAEDLHDNIGSVLATLKLHFENLKLNRDKKHFNQEELYNKTEKLIDETYLKVRSIAHAKNAGVIANQGLLVAIKIMTEKISAANQIKIHVIDYGLDERLENSIEITIFRIIQELTTNIIKHADAAEATINISHFDNTINIIIEDDGKGFNIQETKLRNGMGISSIQKRIHHLKGTFQVDSTINKGTSIIINIPIINT